MGSEMSEPEDRRIDLVIRELKRYNIKVAALQETKWFGNAVYHVGKSIVLTAGRETPQGCQPRQRGEGVAIVFTDHAVSTWKAGGEQWRSWGSRIIKATLGEAAGRPVVYTSYRVMHRHLLQAEWKRTIS